MAEPSHSRGGARQHSNICSSVSFRPGRSNHLVSGGLGESIIPQQLDGVRSMAHVHDGMPAHHVVRATGGAHPSCDRVSV